MMYVLCIRRKRIAASRQNLDTWSARGRKRVALPCRGVQGCSAVGSCNMI